MDVESLRLAVYRSFAERGTAPTTSGLADALGHPGDEVAAGLRRLAADRHVVLRSDGAGGDTIVMAHPFAAIPLGFSVMGRETLWWGGCAWDSFALPHLVTSDDEVLVATRCPGCGAALSWVVGTDAPPAGHEVAHFLVPTHHIWDDVVHTCANQRLYCSDACVEAWLQRTGHDEGYVMDLATLWRLASHWYAGRLERGYRRREPAEAADYFRGVGLSGPFWGLPPD